MELVTHWPESSTKPRPHLLAPIDSNERTFATAGMLIGRQDIIGDLARLHRRFLTAADEGDPLLNELELLAAAATDLGMSFSIVSKASGIPRARIEVVLESQPGTVRRAAAAYERQPGGVLCRRAD